MGEWRRVVLLRGDWVGAARGRLRWHASGCRSRSAWLPVWGFTRSLRNKKNVRGIGFTRADAPRHSRVALPVTPRRTLFTPSIANCPASLPRFPMRAAALLASLCLEGSFPVRRQPGRSSLVNAAYRQGKQQLPCHGQGRHWQGAACTAPGRRLTKLGHSVDGVALRPRAVIGMALWSTRLAAFQFET